MTTQPLPYCTYVLFSEKDAMLYIGYFSDLERRIQEHHSGTADKKALKFMLRSTLHTLGYTGKAGFIPAEEEF